VALHEAGSLPALRFRAAIRLALLDGGD